MIQKELRFNDRTSALARANLASGLRSLWGSAISCLLGLTLVHAADPPFEEVEINLPPVARGHVNWGDFDNDGRLDVFMSGHTTNRQALSAVFRSMGDGLFTNLNLGVPGTIEGVMEWGDLNRDGLMDFLISASMLTQLPETAIWMNQGSDNFMRMPLTVLGRDRAHGWGDYDNDGDSDLLAHEGNLATTVFQYMDGEGFVPTSLALLYSSFEPTSQLVDYDNDGDKDIFLNTGLLDNDGQRKWIVYNNEGFGEFKATPIRLQGSHEASASWADYDLDGHLDVLVFGLSNGLPLTRLYRNTGSGDFEFVPTILPNIYNGTTIWGDYDLDGDPDLFLSGWAEETAGGFTRIYRNDGGGLFSELEIDLQDMQLSGAGWGDYDGDGDLDILFTGTVGRGDADLRTFLFENKTLNSNSPPTAPLLPRLESNQILTWDDPGQLGLSYNLRIGTSTGAVDVLSPLSDVSTGFRRLAERGNVDLATRWKADLPPGTYFWSVQSVDAAFRGSPFTDEGMFTVTNYRPAMTYVSDTNAVVSMQRTSVPLEFLVWDLDSDLTNLVMSVHSLNTNLIADQDVLFGGISSNRTMSVFPNTTNMGPVMLEVKVTDEGGMWDSEFLSLIVTNYPMEISSIPDQEIPLGQTFLPVAFQIEDVETASEAFIVNGTSSNPELIASEDIIIEGTGNDRMVVLSTVPQRTGDSMITLNVTDEFGLMISTAFEVRVRSFSAQPEHLFSAAQSGVAWGDNDRDGDLDLLLKLQPRGRIRILQNTTDSFSIARWVSDSGSLDSFSDVRWSDFDHGGILEIVGFFRNGIEQDQYKTIFVGKDIPEQKYYDLQIFPDQLVSGELEVGDLNNDGLKDILFFGRTLTDESMSVVWRNRRLYFDPLPLEIPFTYPASLDLGDYDLDGDLDILISGKATEQSTPHTSIFRNDGNLVFNDSGVSLPGVEQGLVTWCDGNNDGRLDIFLAGTSGTNALTKIWIHDGIGSYADSGIELPQVYDVMAAWGDWDNNGFSDLLLAGTTTGDVDGAVLNIYTNSGQGLFESLYHSIPAMYQGDAAWGDVDRDGDLDLAVSGLMSSGPGLVIYQNHSLRTNTPPLPPRDFRSIVGELGTVHLRWSPGSDLETTNHAGLTYNIRMGTTPGGQDIMSPSLSPNGSRLLTDRGNAGPATQWAMHGLLPGDYYWSVQSIDPGLEASLFSGESFFTVTNYVVTNANFQLEIERRNPDEIWLIITGTPWANVVLEMSSDFKSWTTTETLFGNEGGRIEHLVEAPLGEARFYRIPTESSR